MPPAIPGVVCRAKVCQEKYSAFVREQYHNEQARLHELRQLHLSRVLQQHDLSEQNGEATQLPTTCAKSDPSQIPCFAVPANLMPLVELPVDRREKFIAHLQQVTDEAFEINEPNASHAESIDEDLDFALTNEVPVADVVSAACGTCRGYCCRHGAHHAFYSKTHIQHLRQRHPTHTSQQIIELIAGHLPRESVQDSCVMHGPQGCSLPREFRAELCNRFECSELVHIIKSVDVYPIRIVAIDGGQLIRQTKYPSDD